MPVFSAPACPLLRRISNKHRRLRVKDQSQDNGKPKQDAPAEAGGPGNDIPYAIPKKNPEAPPPPPPPPTPKKVEGLPDYSLKVNVPLVNVDVLVTTKDGQFVPGLKQDNFRISEDGVPRRIELHGFTGAHYRSVAGGVRVDQLHIHASTRCRLRTPSPIR